MFTAERYVRPATLQEALELNRKRSSTILGGGCWLRLGRKRIGTLIDLSGLGLDQIEEPGWLGAYRRNGIPASAGDQCRCSKSGSEACLPI